MSRLTAVLLLALCLFFHPFKAVSAFELLPPHEGPAISQSAPESGGLAERMVAGIINSVSAALRGTGLMSLGSIMYNVGLGEREARWLMQDDKWQEFAMPAYRAFGYVAYALMFLSVITGGIKLAAQSSSPQQRARTASMFMHWFIAAVLIVVLPSLFEVLIGFNNAMVAMIRGLVGEETIASLSADLAGIQFTTGSILLTAIVNLAFTFLLVYFNALFFVRWFVVTALFSIAPLTAWVWVKGQSTAFFLWLGECISNVLMQFVYALVFGMALLILRSPDLMQNWLTNLLTLSMVLPVASLLRRLITQWLNIIGFDEEGHARGVVGAGVGSLVAVAGALANYRTGGSSPAPSYGQGGGHGVPGPAGGASSKGGSPVPAGGGVLSRAAGLAGGLARGAVVTGAGVVVGAALAPVVSWKDAGQLGIKAAGATGRAYDRTLGRLKPPAPELGPAPGGDPVTGEGKGSSLTGAGSPGAGPVAGAPFLGGDRQEYGAGGQGATSPVALGGAPAFGGYGAGEGAGVLPGPDTSWDHSDVHRGAGKGGDWHA